MTRTPSLKACPDSASYYDQRSSTYTGCEGDEINCLATCYGIQSHDSHSRAESIKETEVTQTPSLGACPGGVARAFLGAILRPAVLHTPGVGR